MAESIQITSLKDQTRERYLIYALSVITSRALPDVRDGLKPVQRRILYTMYNDLRLTFDGRPRKCAKIVGDVTGNYHPHGTSAAYDALVRLAQSWVLRVPLIQGQGNFGSVDGDPPAAERYTEAKLSTAAEALMLELKQKTVDMRPNYDNTREEPIVLPAQFPNLLVNGSSGIAVGMATNIPPHHPVDVIRSVVALIDEPDSTTAQLLDKLKGPDFPLGGRILADRADLRRIYEEGTGTIRVQGEWKIEETAKIRQIVVTSIPYGVDKGKLESDIGAIIEDKKLPQLVNLVNESNEKEGLRIVLEIKAGADPDLIMAYLFKHTSLQDTFSCNLTCLVPVEGEPGKTRPERLGLKSILEYFLRFRRETVQRRFEFELEQLRKRIHILEGFAMVFDALDRAIRIIRASSGKADASEKLRKAFPPMDEVQAEAILEAALYRIAQLEIQKILDELHEKSTEAKKIENILASPKRLLGVVRSELESLAEVMALLAGPRRRTKIVSSEDAPDFDPEAYIVRENTNVVLTRDGWIKRVGKLASLETTRVRENDGVIAVAAGSTLDPVIFLAEDGTAYTGRMNEVPPSSGYGEPIGKYFKIADQVRILTAISGDPRFTAANSEDEAQSIEEGPWVFAVTQQGMAVRIPLGGFRTLSTKAGRKYLRLAEGDRVVLAGVVSGGEAIHIASAHGRILLFRADDIPVVSGPAKGVIAIRMDSDDTCLGGILVTNSEDTLVVESAGGKTLDFKKGRCQPATRGGRGQDVAKRSGLVRVVPAPIPLVDWDNLEDKPSRGRGSSERGNSNRGGPGLFD
ncbi:MAG: DNA topoisomerase 4 subunit A [Planctomycetota bacterium]|nr:DNA topoisomerase 4 subunit A [Planctomycetota bacterium]